MESDYEKFTLLIHSNWKLSADHCQWILSRGRHFKGRRLWQPISFIASNKRILRGVLLSKGIDTSKGENPSLNAFLRASPQEFLVWRREFNSKEWANAG